MSDFSERATQLLQNACSTASERAKMLEDISDIRDRIELVHSSLYNSFLEHLFPAFEHIDRAVGPTCILDDVNNKIRLKLLEILVRLPINDSLRAYASRMMQLNLGVVSKDNEENALVSMRIIFELFRAFKQNLDSEAPNFLELVHTLYNNFEASVSAAFDRASIEFGAEKPLGSNSTGSSSSSSGGGSDPSSAQSPANAAAAGTDPAPHVVLLRGIHSFRVMVECPLIVMFLVQLHPPFLRDLTTLLPIMLKALAVRIPSATLAVNLTAKELRCRQFRFESFVSCDVKTLSFLVYVLLSHPDKIAPFEAELAYSVFILFKTVPAELFSARKELLVATRHILSTDCAKAFCPYLNAMLDESVLLGEQGGRFELATQAFPFPLPTKTSPQTQALPASSGGVQQRIPQRKHALLQLACAALVDLVQTMRGMMDLTQLTRVVYIFTRMVHDPMLPLSMQATCVRLLLNLVDGIFHYRDTGASTPAAQQTEKANAFSLLQRILDCLVRKLGTIRALIPKVAQADRAFQKPQPAVDSIGMPLDAYIMVKPSSGAPGNEQSQSRQASPGGGNAATSAPGAAAAAPTTNQVVSVPVLSNGYSGVRRRRPVSAATSTTTTTTEATGGSASDSDRRELDRSYIIGISSHPQAESIPPPEPINSMRDVCYVIRIIVAGLKTVFFCLTNIDQQGKSQQQQQAAAKAGGAPPAAAAPPPPAPPRPMSDEDIRLLSKYFCWTLQCLPAFRYQASLEPHEEGAQIDNNEESDVLDLFANSFTLLESTSFSDLLAKNMDFFYLCMLRNPLVQRVAHHFLRSTSTSRAFTSIVIPFLLSRFSLLSGRYGPVYSSLEALVDSLTKNRDETESLDLSWPLLCAPPHKVCEPKVFESTYYGGWLAPRLDMSKVPQSGVDAVLTPQGLGLESLEDTFMANKQEVAAEFPKDEEAHLIFKLFRSAFHSTVQLTKASPSPQATESAVALFAAYIEPSIVACFAHAAETNSFPLQPLRSGVFVKIEEDQAENSVVVLRSILACVLDAPNDIRDALLPTLKKLSKPMARSINKLLIVNDFSDPLSLSRADNLADLAVSLTFLLTEDPNIVALPLSHALSSSTRGNDVLVAKALTALERLVPSSVYDRISIARGGLVSKAVKALLKSPMHLAQAMRLEGKCTTEYPAQVFFCEERNEKQVVFPVLWNTGAAKLELTRTVGAACRYLQDCFLSVNSADKQSQMTFFKHKALALLLELVNKDAKQMMSNNSVLDALLTCACDAELGTDTRAALLQLLAAGGNNTARPIGAALARLLVVGCPHRALAAKEILTDVDSKLALDVKRECLLQGMLPALLTLSTNQSWQERTGAFAGIKFMMETSLARELCTKFEAKICDSLLFGLKHHAMEFGHDVLFHLGNALDLFLSHVCRTGGSGGARDVRATLNKFVVALYRCEDPRSRRILRGAIYLVFSKNKANEDMVFQCFQDLLHSNPSTTRSKSEAIVSIFAAKTDFFLFYLELFAPYCATPEAMQREVSFIFDFFQDVLLRWRTFFVGDDEREVYDLEAYCFTFYPRSITLKSSFLLLGLQLVKLLGVGVSQKRPNFVQEMLHVVFVGVASSYAALNHASFGLLQALARVEAFAPLIKAITLEYVNKRITERGTTPLSVFTLRGLGLILQATRNIRILADNFPAELLALLNERVDSVRVLTNLPKRILPGEEAVVPSAIIDLFCHLPTAPLYMEQILAAVFKHESHLVMFHFSHFPPATATAGSGGSNRHLVGVFCGNKLSSPYRDSLSRFIALHPGKALQLILTNDRLIKRAYSTLLGDLLRARNKYGDVLRKELIENPVTLKLFMAATFQAKYEAPQPPPQQPGVAAPAQPLSANDPAVRRAGARVVELRFLGLRFLRNVLKWNPEFLSVYPDLAQQVLNVVRLSEEKLPVEEKLPLRHQKVTKLACKCVIAGFKSSSVSSALVGVLTDLLPMTYIRSSMDPTFLLDFFHKICKKSNPMFVREILSRFTAILVDAKSTVYVKEASLRIVIIPVLSLVMYNKAMQQKPASSSNGSSNAPQQQQQQQASSLPVDQNTMDIFIKLIINERAYAAFRPSSMEEDLEVQLLQLSTLMICHAGKDLLSYRKELIQVAWNHLKGEETNAKHWAYLNICTFMDVYSTPTEIILSIFVELLKAHSAEASELVCRALDLLSPVLHRRLDVEKFTKSIRWTKKLLFDEGHSIPQLVHVLQMICHHPSIFYHYRAQFVPQMVNALNKIGSPHNCPIENRELAMNLVEVMLSYERTRQLLEESAGPMGKDDKHAFRLTHAMFSIMFGFIIRIGLQLSEAKDHRSRACFARTKLLLQSCLDLARQRCQKSIPIPYLPLFGKSLASHHKKLMLSSEADQQTVRKHFADPSPEMRSMPSNTWERVLEPGLVTCVLELLLLLLHGPDLVAVPFFNDNIEAIVQGMFEPAMASPERDMPSVLSRFVHSLLLAYGRVESESRFAASWQKFHTTLRAVLHKRLVLVSTPPPMPTMLAPNAPIPPHPATIAANGGRAPPANMPKLVQQRLAKELLTRQTEHTGTGPRGIVTTLRLLQLVCANTDPVIPGMSTAAAAVVVGNEDAVEPFFPVLTQLSSRFAKEYAVTFSTSARLHHAQQQQQQQLHEDAVALAQRKQQYTQILDICFSLLARVIHYKQAHAESQKMAMQLMAGLLEKLDVGDMPILLRIVRTIHYWLKTGMLYQGTVTGFWTRLVNLENKLSGLPLTNDLIREINSLALVNREAASTFLASQSRLNHQILFTGLCSPCPKQADEFWHLVFSPLPPLGLIKFRQDNLLLIATNKFWLPILVRYCVEAHLESGALANILPMLALGDGEMCVSVWKDLLPSLWSTLGDAERESMAEALLDFLSSPHHPVTSITKSVFEQHRKEHLLLHQRRKQEFRRLTRGIGTPHSSAANLFESLCGLADFLRAANDAPKREGGAPDILPYLAMRMDCKYSYLFAAEQYYYARRNLVGSSAVLHHRGEEALVDVYTEIGEDDWVRGVLRGSASGGGQGFALEFAGEWRQAFEYYRGCLQTCLEESRTHKQASVDIDSFVSGVDALPAFRKRVRYFDDETDDGSIGAEDGLDNALQVKLLENRMHQCLRVLGEWRTLHQLARTEGNTMLLLETAYSQANLYKLCPPNNLGTFPTSQRNFDSCILELQHALKTAEGSTVEQIDDGLKKCLKVALSTPYMTKAHYIRYTEMDESVSFHLRALKHPEQRIASLHILSQTWLSRGPPASLSCTEWAGIMNWRCEFLRMVQDANAPLVAEETSLLIQSAKHARNKAQTELSDFYFQLAAMRSKAPNMTTERIKSILNTYQVDLPTLSICYAELEENRNKFSVPQQQQQQQQQIQAKNSVLSEIHRLRARILALAADENNLALVEQALTLALQADGNNARIWLDWGRILVRNGNFAEASVCIARAIALGYAHARFLIPALLLDAEGAATFLLESIPPATFIPWISTFIQRADSSPFAKASLESLMSAEPHATLHEIVLGLQAPTNTATAQRLLEHLASKNPEIVQENDYLVHGLREECDLLEWRGKSLRIPGTRRKLDRVVVDGHLCGRARRRGVALEPQPPRQLRISLYSDDGRAPVRFAVHNTGMDQAHRQSLVLFYLFFALLDQENHLLECFSPPAVFGLASGNVSGGGEAMIVEKDTSCQSISWLEESLGGQMDNALTRWFTRQFSDLELFFIGRKRMIFQLAAHFVAGSLAHPLPGLRTNDHLLLGRGVESTFVLWCGIGSTSTSSDDEKEVSGFEIAPMLQELITPQGMWGPFASAVASMVRLASRNDIKQSLALFLGEERLQQVALVEEGISPAQRDERVLEAIRQAATGSNAQTTSSYIAKWAF